MDHKKRKRKKPTKSGYLEPYALSRQNVEKYFPGLSPKTLANQASQGKGPPYFKVGNLAFYLFTILKKYVTSNPVQTIDQEVTDE